MVSKMILKCLNILMLEEYSHVIRKGPHHYSCPFTMILVYFPIKKYMSATC